MYYYLNRRVRIRFLATDGLLFALEIRLFCRIGPFRFYRWVHVRQHEPIFDTDAPHVIVTAQDMAEGLLAAHIASPSRKENRKQRQAYIHYKSEFNHKKC